MVRDIERGERGDGAPAIRKRRGVRSPNGFGRMNKSSSQPRNYAFRIRRLFSTTEWATLKCRFLAPLPIGLMRLRRSKLFRIFGGSIVETAAICEVLSDAFARRFGPSPPFQKLNISGRNRAAQQPCFPHRNFSLAIPRYQAMRIVGQKAGCALERTITSPPLISTATKRHESPP